MTREMTTGALGLRVHPGLASLAGGPQRSHALASGLTSAHLSVGGHPAVGEACEKELIPLLAASAPALPVCMARLAGALAAGLTHTHRLLPSWVGSSLPLLCLGSAAPPPRGHTPSHPCQLRLATTGPLSWERAGWEMGPRDLVQKQVRVRGSQRKAKKERQHESKGKWGPHASASPQALCLTGTPVGTQQQGHSP